MVLGGPGNNLEEEGRRERGKKAERQRQDFRERLVGGRRDSNWEGRSKLLSLTDDITYYVKALLKSKNREPVGHEVTQKIKI